MSVWSHVRVTVSLQQWGQVRLCRFQDALAYVLPLTSVTRSQPVYISLVQGLRVACEAYVQTDSTELWWQTSSVGCMHIFSTGRCLINSVLICWNIIDTDRKLCLLHNFCNIYKMCHCFPQGHIADYDEMPPYSLFVLFNWPTNLTCTETSVLTCASFKTQE